MLKPHGDLHLLSSRKRKWHRDFAMDSRLTYASTWSCSEIVILRECQGAHEDMIRPVISQQQMGTHEKSVLQITTRRSFQTENEAFRQHPKKESSVLRLWIILPFQDVEECS